MKVLHIVGGIEKKTGGPGRIAINLCGSLLKHGTEIELVTMIEPSSPHELIDCEQIEGRVRMFERLRMGRFSVSKALKQWLLDNLKKYDLVHIHGLFSYSSYTAAAIARKADIPYLIAPHGMLEPWAFANKPVRKSLGFHLVEKQNLKGAAVIHATSTPEIQTIYSRCGHSQIKFIPNGINLQIFEQLPGSEAFYQQFPLLQDKDILLFLGRIDPKKGLDLLAPAFARLNPLFPQTHLVIAGPDSIGFQTTAEQYFVDAGCRESVTFTGNLSGNLKYSALAAASAYVAPSYSEGFSVSVLEGMAAGLPCIITTGCNFPEAETAKVAYVAEVNVDAIAAQLVQCFENIQESKLLGDRARQFIFDHYTWDQVAAQMSDLYDNILAKRSQTSQQAWAS